MDRIATASQLPLALRAAYLAMHRQTDACLARHGCTADQLVLLGLLARDDGITQQELARRASSDPNTIRAMLVLLEERGLIARGGHPTDGRARSVTLTGKGRRLQDRLWASSEPLRERLRGLFDSEEARTLVDLLSRVAEGLSRPQSIARPRRAAGAPL
jgi:DNA-binding MarR family transcriptional regulator